MIEFRVLEGLDDRNLGNDYVFQMHNVSNKVTQQRIGSQQEEKETRFTTCLVSCVLCMGCYSAFMGALESVKKGNPFLLQSLSGCWMGCSELIELKSRLADCSL